MVAYRPGIQPKVTNAFARLGTTRAEGRKRESIEKGSRTLNFSVESSALEMLESGSGRAGDFKLTVVLPYC
jgi:hypothetical protein